MLPAAARRGGGGASAPRRSARRWRRATSRRSSGSSAAATRCAGPSCAASSAAALLGFPTANIAVTADRALPAFGVYATWAYLGETRYASATNIGTRPTFGGERVSVETYIFDFDRDIYDQLLRIELVARLRPEQKFDGLEAIKAQIERDVAQARALLARADSPTHPRPCRGTVYGRGHR